MLKWIVQNLKEVRSALLSAAQRRMQALLHLFYYDAKCEKSHEVTIDESHGSKTTEDCHSKVEDDHDGEIEEDHEGTLGDD